MYQESGFIRIPLLIIVAILILFLSGVSLRNQVENLEPQETAQYISSRAENIYINHLQLPIEQLVVQPATVVWKYTKEYGISVIAGFLGSLLKKDG